MGQRLPFCAEFCQDQGLVCYTERKHCLQDGSVSL